MQVKPTFWPKMFLTAALFNFAVSIPVITMTRWTYVLSFVEESGVASSNALRLWSDFGFAVFFIGVGYYLVYRDVAKNHGIVWLGIISKLFDVIVLSCRFLMNVANGIVLIPAAIDSLFIILFAWFLYQYGKGGGTNASQTELSQDGSRKTSSKGPT